MPYPSGHAEKTRARIVASARRLFNRSGFDNVSINQIMEDANLTRGAFYSYFDSKSDLYTEVMNCFFTDPNWSSSWEGPRVDLKARDSGAQIIRAYLSREHFDNADGACPLVALPTDVARSNSSTKRAFQNVFMGMARALESGLKGSTEENRATAQAVAALCVGGMVVARAMEDHRAADELRRASMSIALQLGGWSNSSNRKTAARSRLPKPRG